MDKNMEISAIPETCPSGEDEVNNGPSGEDEVNNGPSGEDEVNNDPGNEGKININTSGDDNLPSGDQNERNCPTRAALNNPIILKKIFSNLGSNDVKVVRTVCKAWEDEGSITLGKLCRLPLDCLFDNYKRYQGEPLPVNPKLLQCVYIRPSFLAVCIYRGLLPGYPENVTAVCFNSFASMWHCDVEELRVDLDMYFTICSLHSTLSAHGFPNLTKLTITKQILSDGIISNPNQQLRCMNALKELQIVDVNCSVSDSYSLLQDLITSAPNLEVLDIQSHFVPNLGSCRNLTVLKWIGQNGSRGAEQLDIEPNEVVRMINEVGSHLEHLTIGVSLRLRKANSPVNKNKFDEPFLKLPKVKSLTLEGIDLLNVVKRISPGLLPNLHMVSYPDVDTLVDASGMEQGCYLTHKGVTSLGLSVTMGLNPITMASKKFPNVKRLVIKIEDPKETAAVVGIPYLDTVLLSVLEASSTWKLTYLEVQIGKLCNLSQLLEGLKTLSVVDDGIKKVGITLLANSAGSRYLVDDDQDYDLQTLKDVLELGAKFDRMILKGFGFALKPTTKEKVIDFLKKRLDLPVLYVD